MDHISLYVKVLPNEIFERFVKETNEGKETGTVSPVLVEMTRSIKESFCLPGFVSEYYKLVSDAMFMEIANRWVEDSKKLVSLNATLNKIGEQNIDNLFKSSN